LEEISPAGLWVIENGLIKKVNTGEVENYLTAGPLKAVT